VIFGAILNKKNIASSSGWLFRATLLGAFVILALCPASFGQTPIPAATGAAKDNPGGFTPGWTLGGKFEGSYSGDGGVYDFGSALGYNFSRHFGADAGVPFYFVSTPTFRKETADANSRSSARIAVLEEGGRADKIERDTGVRPRNDARSCIQEPTRNRRRHRRRCSFPRTCPPASSRE